MSEPSDLPPVRRLIRYRQLASDARREAERAPGAVRQSYLSIAEQRDRLAAELSEQADPGRAQLYRRRAAELLNFAEQTKDPVQRRIRLAMAAMYHRLADELEAGDDPKDS